MIIGEFSDSYPPLMDGVGGVIKNYTLGLKAQGHDAYILTGGYFNAEEYDRENHCQDYVFRMPAKSSKMVYPYGTLKCPRSLLEKLMAIDFDLIHIHSPFYAGAVGIKIARAKHIPLVGTFHSLIADDINAVVHSRQITSIAVKWIMRKYYQCDEVWVPSAATGKVLAQEPYAFKNEITVMENGCDMEMPDALELAAMKQEAYRLSGTDESVPIVIYVGQHKDAKNIPLVLQSLDLLNRSDVDFRMLFVGVGPQADEYKQFVKDHSLDSKVKFLGKITDRRMVASLFAISRLFLFPSLYDTSCLVMREAACFNLPLAFIEGSCTSEGIKDGYNGYLAQNTPESFAATVKRALDDPEGNLAIGKQARKDLYRSWNDIITENVIKRYERLIAQNKHDQA
ncbi:MAG: glycosyltransferase [Sphaerochaetaceae bacterium]|jgi:1,2-diacylglycerol 3-alpha-glucosyltransferase|nr:glycosyltransferase [Sphaerochaetaceae bacterium]